MRMASWLLRGVAVVASLGSGLSKQLEAPVEVAGFAQAGLPVEVLSVFGAVQVMLAVLMLIPRTRRAAAVLLAGMFGGYVWLLSAQPIGALLVFSAVMVPLVLVAGFWSGQAARRDPAHVLVRFR